MKQRPWKVKQLKLVWVESRVSEGRVCGEVGADVCICSTEVSIEKSH